MAPSGNQDGRTCRETGSARAGGCSFESSVDHRGLISSEAAQCHTDAVRAHAGQKSDFTKMVS